MAEKPTLCTKSVGTGGNANRERVRVSVRVRVRVDFVNSFGGLLAWDPLDTFFSERNSDLKQR